MEIRKLALNSLFFIFISSIIFSCITPISLKDDKELNALIDAYKKRNANLEKKRSARRKGEIKKLDIAKSPNGFEVSCNLDNANIVDVVMQLLDKTESSYRIDKVITDGRITTRFDNIPLLDALNLIVESVMLEAKEHNGIIFIKDIWDYKDLPGTAPIQREVPIKNLEIDKVIQLLNGLYPLHPATGSRVVTFGHIPNTNTIYLAGAKDEVNMAVRMLNRADQKIKHIMLDVVIIEFDSNEFKKVDANIKDFASQKLSGVNLNFGSFSQSAIEFTRDSSSINPTKFTAIIDLLISNEKARLISRPFVSALSGTEAIIHITNDKWVIVESSLGGATITAPSPITSGVVLKITPTLLPGSNMIRMDIYVEDSQFLQPDTDVAVEVDKNTVSTITQVENGTTFIIGGLVSNRRQWHNSGFPILRKIPVINMLFAKQSSRFEEKEVAIYVTPNIWEPSLVPPLSEESTFKVE
ncbi:MAG: type II secretion system protein GspD [Candidatus Anammoxibacter sp.]